MTMVSHSTVSWRPPATLNLSEFSAQARHFFLLPQSTTRWMQTMCQRLEIQVVNNILTKPLQDERDFLGMNQRNLALVREIYMKGDGEIWLFGRSVIPLAMLQGPLRRIKTLGSTSLGKLLFQHAHLQRSPFTISQLSSRQLLYQRAGSLITEMPETLWARRSMFSLPEGAFLLSEAFFPALLTKLPKRLL